MWHKQSVITPRFVQISFLDSNPHHSCPACLHFCSFHGNTLLNFTTRCYLPYYLHTHFTINVCPYHKFFGQILSHIQIQSSRCSNSFSLILSKL
uniref:Uncharacterized protein n=1 Tax=Anguilla anguilla TaxID=7936 RepID=A0A0E9V6A0_ANGAN